VGVGGVNAEARLSHPVAKQRRRLAGGCAGGEAAAAEARDVGRGRGGAHAPAEGPDAAHHVHSSCIVALVRQAAREGVPGRARAGEGCDRAVERRESVRGQRVTAAEATPMRAQPLRRTSRSSSRPRPAPRSRDRRARWRASTLPEQRRRVRRQSPAPPQRTASAASRHPRIRAEPRPEPRSARGVAP
jgi:hypothetical protein